MPKQVCTTSEGTGICDVFVVGSGVNVHGWTYISLIKKDISRFFGVLKCSRMGLKGMLKMGK